MAVADQPTDDEAPSASLNHRIRTDITEKIVSGIWPPGHRIPFEHVLTDQYGCSRMTVNKALSELVRAGLIERRRRSGSFVRHPQSQAAILEIHDIKTEVQALGLPYHYDLTERLLRGADPSDYDAFEVETDTPLLQMTCVHFAGKRPYCLEERLINLATVPEAGTIDFADTAPGAWLIAQVPWSAAEHKIRAASADRATAKALDIPKGTACLVVERRTWSSGKVITKVRLTYATEGHTLVARFAPSGE
ncbi:MAG: histidine utilization repressor [Rhizobiaceae bacterium]